jgi:hypothetical protein
MRRLGGALVVLAITAVVLPAVAAPARSALPRLRLTSMSPVRVAGTRFVHGERVRVRYGTSLRVVRASPAGSFVAQFTVSADPCNGPVLITAVGTRGDTAAIKLPERACPPSP